MKKLVTLLVALLLAVLPALAEPMTVLDYTDEIMEDGSPAYYFQELALHLPADWQGKVMALPGENGVSFYQLASYEKFQEEGLEGGGFLFQFAASGDEGFREFPSYEYLGYSEDTSMYYYLVLPTDYPAYMDDDIRAEYDAMCGQIDDVVKNVEYYPNSNIIPAGAGQDAAAEDSAAQSAAVSLEKARYHFEHSSLPRFFYEDPANMLDTLEQVDIYTLWRAFADENGVVYPYQASDYAEHRYTTDGGATLLQIVMPDPEATPQCYRVYMVYNPKTGDAWYYTVEYDNFMGENAFICTWSAGGEHALLDGAAIAEKDSKGYDMVLLTEVARIAELSGDSLKDATGVWNDVA